MPSTMGYRRRVLFLLLAIAVISCLALVAAESEGGVDSAAVCSAGDTREECLISDTVDDQDGGEEDSDDWEEEDDDYDCIDEDKHCKGWAEDGECEKNPNYMLTSCRRSCGVCKHEYDDNDFGEPQIIPARRTEAVKHVISESVKYMQQIIADPEMVLLDCRNNVEDCSKWAIDNGCDKNPKYMKMECAPACQSCDYVLEMKKKCRLEPDGKDAMEKGGMNSLFENMIRLADSSNWQPTVLSRPKKNLEGYEDGLPCEEDITAPCNTPEGPWVLTLENFLTDEEVLALLEWGAEMGFERSQAGDQVVDARTSSQAWCNDRCYNDPLVKSLRDRIAYVTGIPPENYESLQLLKYEEGQFYKAHDDFIPPHAHQAHGPRLLTFFMYFNSVERGGGTRYPRLDNLTVEPKKGRVLIWPSALDDDPYKMDGRTNHEAMAVERGKKYAANAWIHMRDFQTPFRAGCPS